MEVSDNVVKNDSPHTPAVTVDAIIDMGAGMIVLLERKNDPQGWALPGGFVEVGETLEQALLREVKEETGLEVEIVRQFHSYSDPNRDPRGHTVSIVFIVRAYGKPHESSPEARKIELFHQMNLPENICFDHRDILMDYFYNRF
jgi:8-oxo-dGTP diphosphatase